MHACSIETAMLPICNFLSAAVRIALGPQAFLELQVVLGFDQVVES